MAGGERSPDYSFDLAAPSRAAGRWLALCGLASPAALLIPRIPVWAHGALLPTGALLLAAGLLLISRSDTVTLDTALGAYMRRQALGGFHRVSSGALDSFDRLLLVQKDREDAYGGRFSVCDLRLAGPNGRLLPLALGRTEDDAANIGRDLSFRLNLPVSVDRRARPVLRGSAERVITSAVWMAAMVVVALAVRPLIGELADAPRRSGSASATLLGEAPVPEGAYQKYQHQDYHGAEVELRAFIARHPGSPYPYNLLAYALADQRRLDEALEAAKIALKLAPENGDILDTVAEMHQRRREWRTAADYYESALARESLESSIETNTKYGQTLLAMGRPQEAYSHLRRAVELASRARFAGPRNQWTDVATRLLSRIAKTHSQPP